MNMNIADIAPWLNLLGQIFVHNKTQLFLQSTSEAHDSMKIWIAAAKKETQSLRIRKPLNSVATYIYTPASYRFFHPFIGSKDS